MGKIIINVSWEGQNYAAAPQNEDIACVCTAPTLQKLKEEMLAALKEHIEWMKEDNDEIPQEFEGEWDIEWDMSGPALLHSVEGIITKAAISKATGINKAQLTHYASGFRNPRPAMTKKIKEGIGKIGQNLISL